LFKSFGNHDSSGLAWFPACWGKLPGAPFPPEVLANIAICLIHQANYLLDRQIRRLEKDIPEKGGLRENMIRSRMGHRRKKKE
jgi:four helix bundle suffix protein